MHIAMQCSNCTWFFRRNLDQFFKNQEKAPQKKHSRPNVCRRQRRNAGGTRALTVAFAICIAAPITVAAGIATWIIRPAAGCGG
jgi:hypothetical protein